MKIEIYILASKWIKKPEDYMVTVQPPTVYEGNTLYKTTVEIPDPWGPVVDIPNSGLEKVEGK